MWLKTIVILEPYMKKFALVAMLCASSYVQATDSVNQEEWRQLSAENVVVMTLPHGNVYIELAPQFSPKHAERFKSLVQSGYYDGEKFYRVIDGFVAQAGPQDGSDKDKQVKALTMEDEFSVTDQFSYTLVQKNDMFAPQTGFKDGFALGHSPDEKKAWMLHCPGVIAMARGTEPDTGSSHFYITNGQAPRYLDRIMAVFGRVVHGMNHVQAIQRTAGIEGQDKIEAATFTPMVKVRMMSDLPKAEQIQLQVQNTDSQAYIKSLEERRNRSSAFFYKKPKPVLDICQTPVNTRIVKS